MYLSQLARLRMNGESERALNHLERTLAGMEGELWVHGELVAALLNHDDGRHLTAINKVKALAKQHPRHPHVRAVLHQFAALGKAERPPLNQQNSLDAGGRNRLEAFLAASQRCHSTRHGHNRTQATRCQRECLGDDAGR